MADVFDLYVKDNRTIQFKFTEPIMLEDSHVTDWVFHIPRILNNLDVSGWAWWLVYINARGQKYSELLELSEDPESPLEKCIATYTVDYSMSIRAGVVRFSLEAINADTQGTILNEWHTQTYQAKVQDTLQGNQVEFAETESDIISALIIEVQNKVSQLVGGATPEPKNLIADMTDTKKVYLYVGEETGESTNYWYYYNGSAWVAGGLYASGTIVDATPTQGSLNAVQSGGVYSALDELQSQIPIVDPVPTQGSNNAVSSGGVYEALADVSLRPSIPVRQAIFALLESAGYATTTGVSENLAIVEAWVNATTAITLSQTSLTLASRGATSQLTATTIPSGNTVLWESSDASVATVDSTGLVTAVSVGTATITAVSGDIRARCTVTASWEIPDTTAQIAQENMKFYDNGNNHEIRAKENAGITIVYEMDTPSTVLYPAGVIVGDGLTSNNATDTCNMRIYKDGEFVNYWGIYDRWLKAPASSYTEYKKSTNVSEYNEIAFTLDMRYLDESYMYDYTTGQIWFAGINTPYYGMSNVSEAV